MRFSYRAVGPIAAVGMLALLAACSRTQQDWRIAQQAGTPQAYTVFAERHGDSELAAVARQRAAQLTEEAAWQQATRANSITAYRQYLDQYPNGSWSQDARIRMQSRSMTLAAQTPQESPSAMPPGAGPVNTPDGPVDGAVPTREKMTPATPQPALQPNGPAASVGRSAVQLGAFSTVANANSAWTQLSSRFPAELQGLTPQIVSVVSSGRSFYRLLTRVADEAAARRLCQQLQQRSQGCLPVP